VSEHGGAAQAVVSWTRGLLSSGVASHEICVTPSDATIINALEASGIPTLELKPRQKDPGHEDPGVRHGSKIRIKGLEFKAVVLLYSSDAPKNNVTDSPTMSRQPGQSSIYL